MDEDSRQSIVRGQRIRACLMQPESAPVSALEQIAVLTALTVGLFDDVPLEKMPEAEAAVRAAVDRIPADVSARLGEAGRPSEEDAQMIADIAAAALLPICGPNVASANVGAEVGA